MFDLVLIILTDLLNYVPFLVAFLILINIFHDSVWGR